MNKLKETTILLLLCAFLGGCSTIYIDPKAETLAEGEYATLRKGGPFDIKVIVTHLNRNRRGNFKDSFRLPPGQNIVRVIGNVHEGYPEDPLLLTFTAEPGKEYILKHEKSGGGKSLFGKNPRSYYSAWIEDIESGSKISQSQSDIWRQRDKDY